MIHKLINTNIKSSHVLLTPNEVKEKLPLTKPAENTILKFRQEIEHILDFQDRRKFIVVGPCSIHDPKAAIEYG
ncbi:MAG: 3-deoxy-7-phosphoheptulonate synthase, partial [Dolichospermum sp.]